jgi:hypothetical protein
MADCHIETHVEADWRQQAGRWRASVIHTASGRVLYITWPYASQRAAIERARRWRAEEYRRAEMGTDERTLF